MNEKEEIVLRVSHAQFQTIVAHLQVGMYCNVHETLTEITTQAAQQLCTEDEFARAQAAAEVKAAGPHLRKN